MITLEELKKKALRQYDKIINSYFNEPVEFPMAIQFGKKLDKTQGASFIFDQQKELINNSKTIIGYGYLVELKENRKTKQSEIIKIEFKNLSDFLRFTNKTIEYKAFEQNAIECLSQIPKLKELFKKTPRIILEQDGKWADLLKICTYFIRNPTPNQYVRNLPIQIHTKFIEQNQGVLKHLLDFLIVESINANESNFFKRFNLQIEEPSVKVRFLDKSISIHSQLSQISVWLSEFKTLNLACENIIVIENLTTFLAFPSKSQTLALWGGGFAVNLLADIDWLKSKKLYYWGDIDIHGFQILSQFRSHYPKVKSILMDTHTFQKYYDNAKGGEFKIIELTNLNTNEYEIYETILENNFRLEQEKIPLSEVIRLFQSPPCSTSNTKNLPMSRCIVLGIRPLASRG